VNIFSLAKNFDQQRQASIQDDLNKLYDTKPTPHQTHPEEPVFLEADLPTPYFDLNYSGNSIAVLGKTAILNCRVKNIGNKTVSVLKSTCICTPGSPNLGISISIEIAKKG
jgi:hypothetical protein